MAGSDEITRRVERLCRADLDAKRLRVEILDALRPALDFDGYVFALTDPQTGVVGAPLADLPGLDFADLPDLVRLRYLTSINRWWDMIGARTVAASLRGATGDDPTRSALWAQAQRPLGIADTATVVFADEHGCWGFLELCRTGASAFAADDVALLARLAPTVTAGLRAALSRTFDAGPDVDAAGGPAVVIADGRLRVRGQTDAAAAALRVMLRPTGPVDPVPAIVYNLGAALIATECGVGLGGTSARINLDGWQWLTARASRMGDDVVVTVEQCSAAERLDLYARVFGLSARERQVLELLAAGHDTRAVAGRLVVCEHTALDHVKSIMRKTRTHSRSEMLSRARGGAPPAG